ncbi:MAG: TPM domain-containing protein [Burkholderiales bacterium]
MNKSFAILLGIAMLLCTGMASAEIDVPPEGNRITDLTGLLNVAQIKSLEAKLESLEFSTGANVEILVAPALGKESVQKYADRVENAWYPEENAVDKHVLFVVSAGDKNAHFVIGEGLQGALAESDAQSILNIKVIPLLRKGLVAQALADGIDAISESIAEARLDDINPPLHNVMIKPASFGEIAYYLLAIVGAIALMAVLVYAGKRKDLAEYLKSRRKRHPFR